MRTPLGIELDVVGNERVRTAALVEAVVDGTVATAVGSAAAAALWPELAKAFVRGTREERIWFAVLSFGAFALVAAGLLLRWQFQRRTRVGVVVSAVHASRSRQQLRDLVDEARHELRTSTVLLTVSADLPEDLMTAGPQLDQLAETALFAMSMGKKLYRDSVHIGVSPVMPLQAAFRFGARLGYTHTRPIQVHTRIVMPSGRAPTFPRILLLDSRRRGRPLLQEPMVTLPGVSGDRVALALDLQGRGRSFSSLVRACCQEEGYATLLTLRYERALLKPRDIPAVVDQVVAAWRSVDLPEAARRSPRGIFLSGPAGVAVALGARLAFHEVGMWTPYSWDNKAKRYVPVLPPGIAPSAAGTLIGA